MKGEKNLTILVQDMNPVLDSIQYVFCSLPPNNKILERLQPIATFNEAEGLSVIIASDQAAQFNLAYERKYSKITLNIYSSLEAVGFTSIISSALAENNIPANIVAAYHHDHLFIPADLSERCLQILEQLKHSYTK